MIVFLREMLSLLQPGESVAKALRRLGGGNKVGEKKSRLWNRIRSSFLSWIRIQERKIKK